MQATASRPTPRGTWGVVRGWAAPNHAGFPVRWWQPGEVVRGSIVYRFIGG